MNREDTDKVVTKLCAGYKIATIRQSDELLNMGGTVLVALLNTVYNDPDRDGDGEFLRVLEELLVKCPDIRTRLHGVISETYPQYKDHIKKLIVLA